MTRTISLLLILAGLSHVAAAQTPRHLSLDEAVSLALGSSKQLQASRARVLSASADVVEARNRRLPDVTVSGAYLRLAQPTIDLKVNLGGGQQGSSTGEGGATTTSSPSVNQAMYGIANVALPIYTGGAIRYGIQSAEFLQRATALDAVNDRDAVIQNAIAAYANLYKASAAVKLVEQNLTQSNQRVADFSRLEQNGLLARNDLLKAQLQSSNVELSLLDAQNNLEIARINVNLMLGLPQETILETDTTVSYPATLRTLAEWQDLALQSRPDLAAQQQRIKAAETGVKLSQAGLLPSIAITGGYVAAYVPDLITITNAVNAGVGLKYTPSSLWKGSASMTQAKARVQEANAGAAVIEDAVRMQTAQAYEAYVGAIKRTNVLQKAVEQAQENYRIVNNKYNNSLATPTELLEADLARSQAALNEAFAQADASTAWHRLLRVTHTETIGGTAGN